MLKQLDHRDLATEAKRRAKRLVLAKQGDMSCPHERLYETLTRRAKQDCLEAARELEARTWYELRCIKILQGVDRPTSAHAEMAMRHLEHARFYRRILEEHLLSALGVELLSYKLPKWSSKTILKAKVPTALSKSSYRL